MFWMLAPVSRLDSLLDLEEYAAGLTGGSDVKGGI